MPSTVVDAVEHRRDTRHFVQVAGAYRARSGNSRDVWIKDVSEFGCRFFDKFSILDVNTEILIKLGNIGPIRARVRWREGSTVGVQFDHPLHPGVLTHVVEFMSHSEKSALPVPRTGTRSV